MSRERSERAERFRKTLISSRSLTLVLAGLALGVALIGPSGCRTNPATEVPADPGFAKAAVDLEAFIRHEMKDKGLPSLSIAVVSADKIVWARGFGHADPATRAAADAGTIYRAGSISKLFTDVAVMQLVERGKLDLDAPVDSYLPDFAPNNPDGTPITLRHLMTHRAGLVREPPVGSYFDPSEPTLEQTVESLNATELVYPVGSRFKYSNAGLAAAGLVVQRVAEEPFERYVQREIIDPLRLQRTAFAPTSAVRSHLARGVMWTYDGREFAAPEFTLGIGPAANVYSSALDLAHFAQTWFARRSARTQLLEDASLQEMFRPQFGTSDSGGIGLGFFLSRLDGHRRVGHNGAMYGFATELAALPEEGFAVAVLTGMDFANAVTRRIADRALRWLVALREGTAPAAARVSDPMGRPAARELQGVYAAGGLRMRMVEQDGELIAELPAGFRMAMRRDGDGLIADDRVSYGVRIDVGDEAVVWQRQRLPRVEDSRPDPAPARFADLIGEYGWDHDVLYVLEKDGGLYLLIEWLAQYPLRERAADRFRLPDYGLYAGEQVAFVRDSGGTVSHVVVGGVSFDRRATAERGETFRIRPRLPEAELRVAAAAATPPRAEGAFRRSDLVQPVAVDASIRLDIRYATTNNFMGMVFYRQAVALMQRPAAEALGRVQAGLREHGYGLVIFDAYRPWYVTKMFFDATPESQRIFVADPSHGSRHNRGCAVDVTLCDLATGDPVEMVSGYDEFTPRAYPRYPGGTSLQRWHRGLLRAAMEAEEFSVYEHEWWHFDHALWREYPILNVQFR